MKYLLTSLLLFLSSAHAATWYIATNGNDNTGTGSSGAPYATFAKALNAASAGDTVSCQPGTYSQQIILGPGGVNKSGTSGNPITLLSPVPHQCQITNVGSSKVAFLASSVSFIVWNGIDINGGQYLPFANNSSANHCQPSSFASGGAPNVAFWASIENSHDITIENSNFSYAIGYDGVQITSNYLASGQPWLSNVPSVQAGTTYNITVQSNTMYGLGNLLEVDTLCGDMLSIGASPGYGGSTYAVTVQNNNLSVANHDIFLVQANTIGVVIQNNVMSNSWAGVPGVPASIRGSLPAGYRVGELDGNSYVFQNNLIGPTGCCAGGNSNIPPGIEARGKYGIVRRNVFFSIVANAINQDCGYGGIDDVRYGHVFHNTLYGLGGSAASTYTYTTDPCRFVGGRVWVNNLIYNDRQNIPNLGSIVIHDADIFTETSPGGTATFNQDSYRFNLVAPSLTLPSLVSTRPAAMWNYSGGSGEQPLCLTVASSGACTNTASAQSTYPSYISGTIDAGQTPSLRPTFASNTPTTYSTYGLAAGSTAIDAGTCLTTTTGSGTAQTSVPVADAYFFVVGDVIENCATGQTAVIQPGGISYGTYPAGTLTVSPGINLASGQGITQQYTGTAPDVGAIEYGTGGATPVIQPGTFLQPICPSTGRVYSNPAQCH